LSTDSEKYAEIGRHYGAEVLTLRPPQYSGSKSPDIEWVKFTLQQLQDRGCDYDCVSILRPTSPFRRPETIQRAWREFIAQEGVDSLRAVELCNQHPGKMWVITGERMTPILPFKTGPTPWHSNQYAALPEIYVQNASLEIVWSHVIQKTNTISGNTIMPFITNDLILIIQMTGGI
jgi:CMP-N-acetylneuraminic acid synthetase